MNWVVTLGAVPFAAFALALIAPIVLHDPFATTAAFLIGIFVGMLLENARSDKC